MFWASANNNGCRFGHHWCRRTSQHQLNIEVDTIIFISKLIYWISLNPSTAASENECARPPATRTVWIHSIHTAGGASGAPGLLATSSRHARLSAACLVGATSDNNLNDRSNSMSIKTEIMSLRLAEEMIFGLRARSCANCVGFYMIPYIWAHILVLALLMPESVNFWCLKESHYVLDHFVRDGRWMAIGWEVSLPLIRMT